MWLFMNVGIQSMCAGTLFGYMQMCVSVHDSSLWPAKGALTTKVARSHPLVIDGEVVIETNDALGLAQKAAVGSFCPPVQQVS